VEDEHRIIAGNLIGEIEVVSGSKKVGSKVISGNHSGKIVFIEQY
jgi:hypothetical protein